MIHYTLRHLNQVFLAYFQFYSQRERGREGERRREEVRKKRGREGERERVCECFESQSYSANQTGLKLYYRA